MSEFTAEQAARINAERRQAQSKHKPQDKQTTDTNGLQSVADGAAKLGKAQRQYLVQANQQVDQVTQEINKELDDLQVKLATGINDAWQSFGEGLEEMASVPFAFDLGLPTKASTTASPSVQSVNPEILESQ